jgi:hypothetical protein
LDRFSVLEALAAFGMASLRRLRFTASQRQAPPDIDVTGETLPDSEDPHVWHDLFFGPRSKRLWAGELLEARESDQGFYRICGTPGSGKSHITKLFILDVLREVEANPDAKLIVYEPSRQFYSWICSLGLTTPVNYFLPSDTRSVALDFTKDYPDLADCLTLAEAFHPKDERETQKFFGDSVRTIFAQVFDAIKKKLEHADLRLICHVLEDPELTKKVLGDDPDFAQARKLLPKGDGTDSKSKADTESTIHSRLAQMKILAAHLDAAKETKPDDARKTKDGSNEFSLTEFLENPSTGTLVISKDPKFKSVQDPINEIIFQRMAEILEGMQPKEGRKIFIVIDEFPTLAGDKRCAGITDMFLRLRKIGVTLLITYQSVITLKRIYGEAYNENIGVCTNAIYLKQPDMDSARLAADDLGLESGYENLDSTSVNSGTGEKPTNNFGTNTSRFDDRPNWTASKLQGLPPASKEQGINGVAKSSACEPNFWAFNYPGTFIDKIPETNTEIKQYIKRTSETQRLRKLEEKEITQLTATETIKDKIDQFRKYNQP